MSPNSKFTQAEFDLGNKLSEVTKRVDEKIAILKRHNIPVLSVAAPAVITTVAIPDNMRSIFDLIVTICNLAAQAEELNNMIKLAGIPIIIDSTAEQMTSNSFELRVIVSNLNNEIKKLENIFDLLERPVPTSIVPAITITDAVPKDLRNYFELYVTACNQMARVHQLITLFKSDDEL